LIHPHLLQRTAAILLVVDMQEPFLRVIHERDSLVQNISRLVRGARILGIPVLSTVQNISKLGGPISEISSALPPDPAPFEKMAFSAMQDPPFAAEIERLGRKQVVLCGVESHICICQTALGLIAGGFQAHICADAVSSRTEANRLLGIDKARSAGALINSTESVLFEMLGAAGTEEFREILKIVK